VLLLAATHRVLALRQPPASQRLVIHHHCFLQQLFGHQRQTEIGVAFLPITRQRQGPQFGRLAPRAGLAPQPMHQPRIPIGLIPFPDALALAVAYPHQFRRRHQCQFPIRDARHHRHSFPFFPTHG
jgi:hypothetical protein